MSIEDALRAGGGVIAAADYRPLRNKFTRAIAAGTLVRLCPGVLVAADLVDDPVIRARAVHTWRPGHILMGPAAARASFWPDCPDGMIDLAGPQTDVVPKIVRLHQIKVPVELRANRGTAIITNPELTVLDMAMMGKWAALCEGLRRGAVNADSLARANDLVAHRLKTGVRKECLARAIGNPWSVPEMNLQMLYRQAGIDGWVGNRKISCGEHLVVPDIAFDVPKLIVEVDGRKYHTQVASFEADRARGNWLTADGWRILRFTPMMIWNEPETVLEQTWAALAAWRRA